MTARHSELPSMKKPENVDSRLKNDLSSMKKAFFVDGNTKLRLPSMKKPENVDSRLKK